jgi:hypothetical protein
MAAVNRRRRAAWRFWWPVAAQILTELREPEKIVRIHIAVRQSQVAEIDRRARAQGHGGRLTWSGAR